MGKRQINHFADTETSTTIGCVISDEKKFYESSGKFIPVQEANRLIDGHKKSTEQKRETQLVVDSYFFGREKIQQLLNESDSIGLRIHFGVDDKGVQKLVIYPANENGEDMPVKSLFGDDMMGLDWGVPCPPYCPPPPPPIKVPQ